MKKKRIIFSFVALFTILVLTGCGNKKPIDTKTFKEIGNKYSYTVEDISDQYLEYDNIKEATIIGLVDEWQIEFYVLDNSNNALDMFNTNKNIFESSKGNNMLEYSTDFSNNNNYCLESNGMYMYLSRIDNTLLYVNVPMQYKELIKSIVDEIGY